MTYKSLVVAKGDLKEQSISMQKRFQSRKEFIKGAAKPPPPFRIKINDSTHLKIPGLPLHSHPKG